MNAKITITVPIDKLHLTVAEMVESVASQLESSAIDLTGISKELINQKNILEQMENLDKIRRTLSLLDANLEDCYSILSGLVKYKTQQPMGQKNAEQPAE